jgi:hypothetical protein
MAAVGDGARLRSPADQPRTASLVIGLPPWPAPRRWSQPSPGRPTLSFTRATNHRSAPSHPPTSQLLNMGVIDTALGLLPNPAADLARTAHLDNPLNLFLVFLALNLISSLFPSTQPIPSPDSLPDKPTQYNWRPKVHPSPVVWRRWTTKELEKFDGTNNELEGGKLLMAIRRKVYDVSSGKSFYGPGE